MRLEGRGAGISLEHHRKAGTDLLLGSIKGRMGQSSSRRLWGANPKAKTVF